jgi:hypothetical protein
LKVYFKNEQRGGESYYAIVMRWNRNMIYQSHHAVNAQGGALSNNPELQVQGAVAHPGVMDDGARIHLEEAAQVPPAQIQILTD